MKLLISTMTNFVLWDGQPHYLLDGTLEEGKAHYNGITWGNGLLYVSGALDFDYVIYALNPRTFEITGTISGQLHEIHQILYTGGKLYVINTGKNRIEIWNGQRWANVSFRQSSCDIDHLNGIWFDGEQFYISEFRHKSTGPSVVRVCDRKLNLLDTVEIGLPIHNIYRNGSFFTLVSREAGLVEKTDYELINHRLPQLQGMLIRGLARSHDNWFVGASRWETHRDKRHVGDAIIAILNNDFAEVGRIEIKDAGPVCDIRLIDPVDLSHNGLRYPE